jgi:hypothetical protein
MIKLLLIVLSLTLVGCDRVVMTTEEQVTAIEQCTNAGLDAAYRESIWDGEVTGVKCVIKYRTQLVNEQNRYDSCIASNIKHVFTDMDITSLEAFCNNLSE